jgi:CHAT domain-containing protein/tetratricopeptide (TPR) repeat protein
MRQMLATCLLVLSAAAAMARFDDPAKDAPPPKPPWQRYLQGDDARKAAALKKQVDQLREAAKFEDALEAAEALAQLREKVQGTDHWQAVDARGLVESIRRVLPQPAEARREYADSFTVARQAAGLQQQGRYQQAQPLFEKVLLVYRKILGDDHVVTAIAYNNLAVNLDALGKHVEAEARFRKALAIRRKALGEEQPLTASSYTNLARNLHVQGKLVEAEKGFRKALSIMCQVLGEEHPDTAYGYNILGFNLHAQDKYAQAEESFRKALAIILKVFGAENPITASSYNNLANTLHKQGKYAEAEKLNREALAIRRKVLGEEHPLTASSYNNVASSLHAQGKYADAETYYRKSLAINRKARGEEHPETAIGYNNLASNLSAQGRFTEAEEGFRKALTINRKVLGEEHPATALSYNNLASILHDQGKYIEAEAGYRKALAINRKALGEEHLAMSLSYNNVAYALHAQSKYAEAEQGFRSALAITRKFLGDEHPDMATGYNNIAVNLEAQGKYAEAERFNRKALAVRRKVFGDEHPETASNLASNLKAQGNFVEAEDEYRKALAIRGKALGEAHPLTANSYNNLAFALNDRGKYLEAEKFWFRGADSFTRARLRIAPSGLERAAKSTETSPLPFLAAVLARNGKPDDAWQRFEESLGRGTWDDLSARLRRPADEQAKQTELVNRLSRLDQLIEKTLSTKADTEELKKRRDELLTRRRRTQEELDAFAEHLAKTYGPAAGQAFERRQIQACLPADTALIAWLDSVARAKAADPNGEHWAILLRASGDPIWVRLRGSGDKDAWTDADSKLPAELRAVLQSARGDWRPLAQRLRRQRLDPLATQLVGVRHLIVLPSTALAGVPVEVFADGYTVSYALSGTLYAHLRKQSKVAGGGFLALADPVFDRPDAADKLKALPRLASRGDDEKWRQLPGTRAEATALVRLFGDPSAKLLTDSEASEQRIYALAKSGELGNYRYLHLATHGSVDERSPLRSAVILSRDHLPNPGTQLDAGLPVFDGQLTAREILEQWHLHSELVTLSACQTALGKYERGEGFVGFAQALILAGSRSVCLSLWKVNDTATALLMERFYQNLLGKREGLSKPMGKAAALAEAKAWLRGLSRQEAVKRTARLTDGVARGKGRPVQPLLPLVSANAAGAKDDRLYAHPYYWAAFVLIGDPD